MPSVVLDSLFLGLLLLLFALQQPETLAAAALLCAFYAAFRSSSFTVDVNVLTFVLFGSVSLMLAVVFGFNHGYSQVVYLLSTLANFYAARRFGSLSLRHVRLCLETVYWIAVIGIFYGLALHWEAPEPLGEIIPGSSTNGLPSYLIVVQVGLSILVFLEKRRLPVISAITTFVVAAFGLGRASIIASVLIVGLTCAVNVLLSKRNFAVWIVVALIGIVGVGGYLWSAGVFDPFFAKTKWAWGMYDPPRASMLHDYISKLDWSSIWVGANYSGTSIDELYGGNPHNSYIRLHSYFGLIGLLLALLSPFLILISDKLFFFKGVVVILVLLVLLRAMTDPILFPTALDFFYFLYFIVFFKHAPSKSMPVRARC